MNIINPLSWFLAVIYIVVYGLSLFEVIPQNLIIVSLLVLLPPLFYGFAYFVFFREDQDYIKELSEIWGPFWAASSALLLTIYSK